MSTPQKAQFGMVGLAVMGSNLALNVSDHGYRVAVWNKESDMLDRFMQSSGERAIIGARTLSEFADALERPRRIMMMIKAGRPVDLVIEAICPLLENGDILIDGGNSWFKDTQRRAETCKAAGVHFFGCGVSGGEEGARHGPSLMPGGDRDAYEHVRPIFEQIAAKTESGPCVTYCGPDGAGHFVKTVHNGIEYGDMQLIAEAYDILRRGLSLSAGEIADIFAQWNGGDLQSFLIEITAKILKVRDPETGSPLVDLILDEAEQKGTGKWTDQVALDLAVPLPTIASAVDARVLSSMKGERTQAASLYQSVNPTGSKEGLVQHVHDALLASKICSYAQGMNLIGCASSQNGWNVPLAELARIWKGGCIIRARLLDTIMRAFSAQPDLPNLLLHPEFRDIIVKSQDGWRKAVCSAQSNGIPVPAMSGSLAYFDTYRSAKLPANLTQAQRDLFGAHTYIRTDHPERGPVHTEWSALIAGPSTGS